MKLQVSLIMMAALATALDEVEIKVLTDAETPQAPSVWNNWNGKPENMPEDTYGNEWEVAERKRIKEYFVNSPLNQPVDHSYSSSEFAGKCHAIQGDPLVAPTDH